MSEQAKPVCVACKLPIEREQRHAGQPGSGQFSHWNDAQCITALRAALDQERAKAGQAAHLLTQSRIWGGMGWVWNPLRGDVVERAHALLSGRGEGSDG